MRDLDAVRKSIDYKSAITDIKALCLSLVLASCADEVLKWGDVSSYISYVASKIEENINFIQNELEL